MSKRRQFGPKALLLLALGLPLSGLAWGPPPLITVQPLNQTVPKNSSATFTVVATSITTMWYQWRLGGTNIPSGTQSSYTVDKAAVDGVYSVVVMNASGSVTSSPATLHVLLPPQSGDDSYSTLQNKTLSVPAAGVLANDAGFNGLPLTALVSHGASHGTLVLNVDGSLTYIPANNFFGTDSFTYTATDGLLSGNTATVNINVLQLVSGPLQITSGIMTTNGFKLQLSGPSPASYIVYASDDLATWTPLSTNSVTSGSLEVTDRAASAHARRFYRAVAARSQ